jgi:hypothetical protein
LSIEENVDFFARLRLVPRKKLPPARNSCWPSPGWQRFVIGR